MKSEILRTALELSQRMVMEWFAGHGELVYSYMGEHMSWIGSTESQFFIGKEMALEALKKASADIIPCSVSEQNYFVADAGEDFCLCVGRYVVTLDTEGMFMCEPQRITFLWRQEGDALEISHIHLSNVTSVTAPDEEFPVEASKRNYEYVQKKLQEKVKEQEELLKVTTTDQTYHLLSRHEIQYLEADGNCVLIHYTGDETYKVRGEFKKFIKEKCGEEILLIHRAYAVNPYFIKDITAYKITLVTDAVLPVSKGKYAAVYQQLCENY